MLHSVYDQPDAKAVHAQFDRVLEALAEKLPAVAEHLEEARADILAFTAFPKEIWRQIWSNNPISINRLSDDMFLLAAHPTDRPTRSTDGSSTYAAPPSDSAPSPTTSPGQCSRPTASGHYYTLVCEEPVADESTSSATTSSGC